MNPDVFPTLFTERLKLRQLEVSDANQIFLLRSDSTINEYLDRQPSKTLEDAEGFVKNIIETPGLFYWAITKQDNEKLIGTVCLFEILEEQKKCEIGYELLTEYQGKGIMLEAVIKVMDYAVNKLGMTAIEAFSHKENQNSTKLLKKLGFHKEDTNEENSDVALFRFNSANR